MEDYRYILDKSGKKHLCPDCGKKSFVWYIDTETKQYLPEHYGRCDHENKCNFHNRPPLETRSFFVPFLKLFDYSAKAYKLETNEGKYFIPKSQVHEVSENGCYISEYVLSNNSNKNPIYVSTDCKYYNKAGAIIQSNPNREGKPQPQPVYFIPERVLNATLKDYDKNIFIQNLLKLAPVEDIEKAISLYRIGTIAKDERAGAVTFPFIDKAGNIRTIQAKQFDETNHTKSTDFVHSIITRHHTSRGEALPGWLQDYDKNELKVSCLFGEHLLNKYPCNPIALVEAPKTAIIATLYYGLPETPNALLWLAVYNKSSLTVEKCKALQGRKVVLFPDMNAFDLWNTKAQELKAKLPGTRFVVSDLLEKNATETERTNGLDLADYLTKFDYRLFRKEQPEKLPSPELKPEPKVKGEKGEKRESVKQSFFEQKIISFSSDPENWNTEIELLEVFFNEARLPEVPYKFSQYETITSVSKFIQSHFTTVKRYNGNPNFKHYLQRLLRLKECLTTNLN